LNTTAGYSRAPFGYDPQFLYGTALYDDRLPPDQFYSREETFYGRGVWPFGFFFQNSNGTLLSREDSGSSVSEENLDGGFYAFFGVEMDQTPALKLLNYLRFGGFLDSQTESLRVELVTYNSFMDTFAHVVVTFTNEKSGLVSVDAAVNVLRVSLYTYDDMLRVVLEVMLVLAFILDVLGELREMFETHKARGSVRYYFHSVWNYIDVSNLALQLFLMLRWVAFATSHAPYFKPQIDYDVYNR
jgi:hypothetical protein